MIKKKILEKCSKIKILISDVDGVLTDGGMYYSENGEELKKFNTRDGMAIELLQKIKIPVIIMTKENSKIVLQRAKKIKIKKSYIGINKKEDKLSEICKKFKVKLENIAYIGDDINDLEIMKKVGFSASPNNAIEQIKRKSHYICKLNGGEGVLREVAELILSTKNVRKL
jgi:N-acylneuraminate cytidylyltransferase